MKLLPYVGDVQIAQSHPVRVRGLKPSLSRLKTFLLMSHPVRVRGLKLGRGLRLPLRLRSHPVRVRGLKLR